MEPGRRMSLPGWLRLFCDSYFVCVQCTIGQGEFNLINTRIQPAHIDAVSGYLLRTQYLGPGRAVYRYLLYPRIFFEQQPVCGWVRIACDRNPVFETDITDTTIREGFILVYHFESVQVFPSYRYLVNEIVIPENGALPMRFDHTDLVPALAVDAVLYLEIIAVDFLGGGPAEDRLLAF